MTTIIKLAGFEIQDPDTSTAPFVKRTIGPISDTEASAWLTQRGFSSKGGRDWYKGPSVFQRRREDGTMVGANCACVFAKVVIVDNTTDVEISN